MEEESILNIRSNFFSSVTKKSEYDFYVTKLIEKSNNFFVPILIKLSKIFFLFGLIQILFSLFFFYNCSLTPIIFILNSLLFAIGIIIQFSHNNILIAILINISIFLFFHIIEMFIILFGKSDYSFIFIILNITFRHFCQKIYFPLYKISVFANTAIIYYHCFAFERFYNVLHKFFKNDWTLISFFAVKILFQLLHIGYSYLVEKTFKRKFNKRREIFLENTYYSDFFDNIDSALVILNDEMEISFQNNKFTSIVKEFDLKEEEKHEANHYDNSLLFLGLLVSKIHKEELDNNVPPEINEYFSKSLKEEEEVRDQLNSSLIKLGNFYYFLKRYRELFCSFTKISTIVLTEESINYEILLRVGSNQVEFIINEITNINLIRKNKLENDIKGLLIAKIAHDFKSPLVAIDRICQTIKPTDDLNSSSDSDEKMLLHKSPKSYINKVHSSNLRNKANLLQSLCRYVLSLIEDLNTVVNEKNKEEMASPKNERICDLKEACKFCLKIFKIRKENDENKNVDLKLNYDRNLPDRLKINEKIIKQILINLLSNSYKFTNQGSIKLNVTKNNETILFEVTDTGIGIKEELQPNLCKPFYMVPSSYSMNPLGSGLGLYIVNGLVQKFGSELKFNSEYGKGSRFFFEIKNLRDIISLQSDSSITTVKNIFNPHISISQKDLIKDIYKEKNNTNPILAESGKEFHEKTNGVDRSEKGLWNWNLRKSKFHSDISLVNKFKSHSNNSKIQEKSDKFLNIKSQMFLNSSAQENSSSDSVKINRFSEVNIEKTYSSNSRELFKIEDTENMQKINIMICDDEKEVRSALRRLLSSLPKYSFDYSIMTQETFNGIECLYKIYKDFRNGIKYDLLLIDENMPYLKGSTVAYVLKEMKNEGQINNIKIVSISGDTYPGTVKYILSKGVEEIIFKPVNRNSLECLMKSIFSN